MGKHQLKIAGILFLALCLAIVIFQNTDEVTTRILFFTITMPRVILLLLMAVMGFVMGVLVAYHVMSSKKKEKPQEIEPPG